MVLRWYLREFLIDGFQRKSKRDVAYFRPTTAESHQLLFGNNTTKDYTLKMLILYTRHSFWSRCYSELGECQQYSFNIEAYQVEVLGCWSSIKNFLLDALDICRSSRPHKIHRRGEKGKEKGNCFSRLFLPSESYMEPAQGPAPFFLSIIHFGGTRREAAHRPTFHSMIPFSPSTLIRNSGLYYLYWSTIK